MSTVRLALCVGLIPVLLSACNDERAELSRGPIDKADLLGSCAAPDGDYCGGPSDGNCWCDSLCESYGDCCADKVPVCDGVCPLTGIVCTPDCPASGELPSGAPCQTGVWNDDDCECEPVVCCDAADYPEGAIEGAHCCADGTWYLDTGSGGSEECDPVGGDGQVCEVIYCGGYAGTPCPDQTMDCIDYPMDLCNPDYGGADCIGMCVDGSDCPLTGVICTPDCPSSGQLPSGAPCNQGNWNEDDCVCEPVVCCDPDDYPVGAIEGAHCCADGTWALDTGSGGSEECIPLGGDGDVCAAELGETCGQDAFGAGCLGELACCYPCGIDGCDFTCSEPCPAGDINCDNGCWTNLP